MDGGMEGWIRMDGWMDPDGWVDPFILIIHPSISIVYLFISITNDPFSIANVYRRLLGSSPLSGYCKDL